MVHFPAPNKAFAKIQIGSRDYSNRDTLPNQVTPIHDANKTSLQLKGKKSSSLVVIQI